MLIHIGKGFKRKGTTYCSMRIRTLKIVPAAPEEMRMQSARPSSKSSHGIGFCGTSVHIFEFPSRTNEPPQDAADHLVTKLVSVGDSAPHSASVVHNLRERTVHSSALDPRMKSKSLVSASPIFPLFSKGKWQNKKWVSLVGASPHNKRFSRERR